MPHIDIPFRAGHSSVSCPQHFDQLRIFLLSAIHHRKMRSMWYEHKYLESILMGTACPFGETVKASPLGPAGLGAYLRISHNNLLYDLLCEVPSNNILSSRFPWNDHPLIPKLRPHISLDHSSHSCSHALSSLMLSLPPAPSLCRDQDVELSATFQHYMTCMLPCSQP